MVNLAEKMARSAQAKAKRLVHHDEEKGSPVPPTFKQPSKKHIELERKKQGTSISTYATPAGKSPRGCLSIKGVFGGTPAPAPAPEPEHEPDPNAPRLTENQRVAKYLNAAAEAADGFGVDSRCGSCLRASAPVLSVVIWIAVKVAPIYAWLFQKAYWFYTWAPRNVIQMVFGLALCFFGGTYVAAIAAIEAWRQMGWQRSWADLQVMCSQFKNVYEASAKDDLLDENKNMIPDVDELSPKELAQRKLKLAMVTVEEPEKLQTAVGSLWAAYLAVLATLRLQFARVAALALGIAEMVKLPAVRVIAPPLSALLGKDLAHWVPTLITTTINIIAISFAWYLQKILSAFYSGMRGGLMFSRALFAFLDERGWLAKCVCVKQGDDKPWDHNESIIDEVIGYAVAAAGFATQLYYGFSLAFPLNLIFLPLTIVEWILEYQIVMGVSATGGTPAG